MKAIIAIAFAGLLACVLACGFLTSPKFPQDILAEYTCVQNQVEAGQRNVGAIMLACTIPEEAIVADALAALLSSKQWTGDHPELVPHARTMLYAVRMRAPALVAP